MFIILILIETYHLYFLFNGNANRTLETVSFHHLSSHVDFRGAWGVVVTVMEEMVYPIIALKMAPKFQFMNRSQFIFMYDIMYIRV